MREISVTCDQCGGAASVISSVEVFQDADELSDAEAGRIVPDVSCRISCPKCGVHILMIKAHKRDLPRHAN